jgi:hypothetical protein
MGSSRLHLHVEVRRPIRRLKQMPIKPPTRSPARVGHLRTSVDDSRHRIDRCQWLATACDLDGDGARDYGVGATAAITRCADAAASWRQSIRRERVERSNNTLCRGGTNGQPHAARSAGFHSCRMTPSIGSNSFFQGALLQDLRRVGITCVPPHAYARRREIDVFGMTLVFEPGGRPGSGYPWRDAIEFYVPAGTFLSTRRRPPNTVFATMTATTAKAWTARSVAVAS